MVRRIEDTGHTERWIISLAVSAISPVITTSQTTLPSTPTTNGQLAPWSPPGPGMGSGRGRLNDSKYSQQHGNDELINSLHLNTNTSLPMLACLAESAKIVDNLLHIAECWYCFQVLSLQCGGRWWCLYEHNSHLARDSVVTGDTSQPCCSPPVALN